MLRIGFAYIGVKFIVNKRIQNMQICARKGKAFVTVLQVFVYGSVILSVLIHLEPPYITSEIRNRLFSLVYDTFDVKFYG